VARREIIPVQPQGMYLPACREKEDDRISTWIITVDDYGPFARIFACITFAGNIFYHKGG